jgi:predicted transcriptional regulator of viral defense system
MQPLRYLSHWLESNTNNERYLFTLQDMRALLPKLSNATFKTLLSRAVKATLLTRVCRGLYLYKKAAPPDGQLLFHAATLLRANEFNYLSLETVLSDAGIISQIPINWICVLSSGRSNVITCGEFGTIEFIHTNQKPTAIIDQLSYDTDRKLWRANIVLALRDMKATRRNCDLINWDIANEFI